MIYSSRAHPCQVFFKDRRALGAVKNYADLLTIKFARNYGLDSLRKYYIIDPPALIIYRLSNVLQETLRPSDVPSSGVIHASRYTFRTSGPTAILAIFADVKVSLLILIKFIKRLTMKVIRFLRPYLMFFYPELLAGGK